MDQSGSNVRDFIPYEELDVLHQTKVPGIHPEVFHHFGVVEVVGIMIRKRVVAEGCHFFGCVAGQRLINSRTSTF